jgi:uncharacterized DUF497 family protein
MDFVFDPAKSEANAAKHGIDFIDDQALWNDPMLLEADARSDNEARFLVVGRIDDKYWSAVFARREGKVRIISVRRARRQEIERYGSQ